MYDLAGRAVKDPEFARTVRSAEVDIILNVHSLYVIPAPILQAARIGAFNLHPGPLPQYAGLNTVSWAIYRGETTYGVTIHWMVPEIDAGEIAYQATFSIEETDTPVLLTHKCVRAGLTLISELLNTAAASPNAIPRLQQDLANRRYFGKQVPEEGRLSWNRPAREVVNFVRACEYWPYRSPWVTRSFPSEIAKSASRRLLVPTGNVTVHPEPLAQQMSQGFL
jgi:methionyl-tRNA formyltransferase